MTYLNPLETGTVYESTGTTNSVVYQNTTGFTWKIGAIQGKVTTGTGSARLYFFQILDSGSVEIWQTQARNTQAGTTTGRYNMLPGVSNEDYQGNNWFQMSIPKPCLLPSGQYIKFFDSNNVSGTDVVTLNVHYRI